MAAAEGMAGLAKGLAVLEAFGSAHAKLTISDSAKMTGLSRATARRCLLTLVDLGYLSFDGKFFAPTPRTLRLGNAYVDTASLPSLAQPHLAAVREIVSESVSLAVYAGGESLFVARSEVTRIVNTGVRVGATLPAYASATGHVLLAALPEKELDEYLGRVQLRARTPKTPITRTEIIERVEQARRDGFAITDEELELGLRSMAVPVLNSRRDIVAAMSVSAFAARVTVDDMLKTFLPPMREHATMLGRMA
ncbi:MAG TPA: IclR family transcriptional regulator C-terminal domain-containing protein [Trebonia sp.]